MPLTQYFLYVLPSVLFFFVPYTSPLQLIKLLV
jgi:hypothetical protein